MVVLALLVVVFVFSLTDHSSSTGGAVTDVTSGSKNTSLSIALHVWQSDTHYSTHIFNMKRPSKFTRGILGY